MKNYDIKEIIDGTIDIDDWDCVYLSDFVNHISKNPMTRKSITTLLTEVGPVTLSKDITKSTDIIYNLVLDYINNHSNILVVDSTDGKGFTRYLVRSQKNTDEIYDITWDDDYGMSIEDDEFKSSIYRVLEDYETYYNKLPQTTLDFVSFLNDEDYFYKLKY